MNSSIVLDTSHLQYYRDSPDNYCHFVLGNLLETFITLKASNLLKSRFSVLTTNNPSDLYADFYQVLLDTRSPDPETAPSALTIAPRPQTNWKDQKEHLALEHLDGFIAFLRERFATPLVEADTVTYIRRPFAFGARRAIVNEPQLIRDLQELAARSSLNFEAVDLAGTSLEYQVGLMHRTKLLVGLHGAGLLNAMFCQPGSHLLEIRPHRQFKHRKFRMLCESRGVNHHIILSPLATVPSLYNLKKQVKSSFELGNRFYRDRVIIASRKQVMVRADAILTGKQAT